MKRHKTFLALLEKLQRATGLDDANTARRLAVEKSALLRAKAGTEEFSPELRFALLEATGHHWTTESARLLLPDAIEAKLRKALRTSRHSGKATGVRRPVAASLDRPEFRAWRKELGINQTEFWSMLGCSQETGSRYETRTRAPKWVKILAQLRFETGTIGNAELDWARKVVATRQPKKLGAALDSPRQAREARWESQQVFWGRIGILQTTASRYESGREMPLPAAMLLVLFLSGKITEADLMYAQR